MKENTKNRESKEYIQKTNTLRLMLMYPQFEDVEDAVFAFNVLKEKNYEKSVYIAKAIKYYEENISDSIEMSEALFPLRCARFIKCYYKINSKKDVENLLSGGLSSTVFIDSSERMLKSEAPRNILLGFNKNSADAKAMHKKLFEMKAGPRLMLIAAATKKYVMDGQDSAILMSYSFKLIHDLFKSYDEAESHEKKKIVNTLYNMIQKSAMLAN